MQQLTQTELKKLADAVHTMIEVCENNLSFIEAKEWRVICAKLQVMIRELELSTVRAKVGDF